MQVTLFGGSGFHRRCILRELLARGLVVRVASRRRPTPSAYVRARAAGEAAVEAGFAGTTILMAAVGPWRSAVVNVRSDLP